MTPRFHAPAAVAPGPQLVEKLVHDIDEQLEQTIDAGERARVMAIVRQCLTATLSSPASAALSLTCSDSGWATALRALRGRASCSCAASASC
ncbi:hypothetical protein D9M73_233950 [compost metagenome]